MEKLVLLLWEQNVGAIEQKLLLLEFVAHQYLDYCPGAKPVRSQTGVEGGQKLRELGFKYNQ